MGPASKRIIVAYGFWVFLLSDIIMFSAFFAAYAVLSGETAGGPSGAQLFHLNIAAIETGCLLLSSFTCGLASLASAVRSMLWDATRTAGYRAARRSLLITRIARIRGHDL